VYPGQRDEGYAYIHQQFMDVAIWLKVSIWAKLAMEGGVVKREDSHY
jgi:hypothetical protein